MTVPPEEEEEDVAMDGDDEDRNGVPYAAETDGRDRVREGDGDESSAEDSSDGGEKESEEGVSPLRGRNDESEPGEPNSSTSSTANKPSNRRVSSAIRSAMEGRIRAFGTASASSTSPTANLSSSGTMRQGAGTSVRAGAGALTAPSSRGQARVVRAKGGVSASVAAAKATRAKLSSKKNPPPVLRSMPEPKPAPSAAQPPGEEATERKQPFAARVRRVSAAVRGLAETHLRFATQESEEFHRHHLQSSGHSVSASGSGSAAPLGRPSLELGMTESQRQLFDEVAAVAEEFESSHNDVGISDHGVEHDSADAAAPFDDDLYDSHDDDDNVADKGGGGVRRAGQRGARGRRGFLRGSIGSIAPSLGGGASRATGAAGGLQDESTSWENAWANLDEERAYPPPGGGNNLSPYAAKRGSTYGPDPYNLYDHKQHHKDDHDGLLARFAARRKGAIVLFVVAATLIAVAVVLDAKDVVEEIETYVGPEGGSSSQGEAVGGAVTNYSPPPPPPSNLAALCSSLSSWEKTEEEEMRCKALCDDAECCFAPEWYVTSCQGEDGCVPYEEACPLRMPEEVQDGGGNNEQGEDEA